jgi:predicted esterase
MQEHHFSTPRSARYFTLGEPGPQVRDLWVVCHGYGQLAADFLAGFEGIAAPERIIVAPEGLSRFYIGEAEVRHGKDTRIGASWMTRADRLAEIDDYVTYLDGLTRMLLAQVAPDARVRALGFSQGVSTVCRWATRGATRPAELILWAGEPVFESLEGGLPEPLRGVPIHVVGGARDRIVSLAYMQKQRERLQHAGAETVLHQFDGGHRMDRQVVATIAAGR